METNQLSAFYQSVVSWPASDAELSSVAEKISKLLDAPFAAIHRRDGAGKVAFKFVAPDATVNSDAMDEYTRRKFSQIAERYSGKGGPDAEITQLQLAGEYVPWNVTPALTCLAIACLWGENRASIAGGRTSRGRHEYGWLIIGVRKPLSIVEEVLLQAAARHLSSLAEIFAYESAIQIRSQFLSIASHELKTPLTSIYGILQLQERMFRLKKEEPTQQAQERQESYLKMVIRQVQRLNELIDGLLDVSRIQNGRFMVEPSETDVVSLVRETSSARLALIAQEAGVKISLDLPESLRAWVDPVRMEEVITNMVMNAIRFSPEGGVVWVRLRDDSGSLRLTIRDQGPAVPVEDRERIFQPFERAQRTARFGGLGLGLFISRQIAQLHGGNVGLVESLPGKGNVFEASLPMRSSGTLSASA